MVSKEGVILESDIKREGRESMKITVLKEGCIRCNVVGENPHSSDFVMKDGLEMIVEGVIRTRSRSGRWSRSVGWTETSTRTKTTFYLGQMGEEVVWL